MNFNDFLNGLYSKINDDDSLECVLLSDYIEKNKKNQLNKIAPGSWINRLKIHLFREEGIQNLLNLE